jgi:hypothetical protein
MFITTYTKVNRKTSIHKFYILLFYSSIGRLGKRNRYSDGLDCLGFKPRWIDSVPLETGPEV